MLDFGSILERLQGSLGKGYTLAGILPVALFFAFSISLAYVNFEFARYSAHTFLSLDISNQIIGYFAASTTIALIGFILWNMNTWLRATLEGKTWPGIVRTWCEAKQRSQLDKIEKEIEELHDDLFHYRRAQAVKDDSTPSWKQRLNVARAVGSKSNNASNEPLSEEFTSKLTEARETRQQHERIEFALMDSLVRELEAQLEKRSAKHVSVLDDADREVRRLIEYSSKQTENAYGAKVARRAFLFPKEADLGPTRFANAAILHEDYMLTRYGMSPALFWPGIEHRASQDETILFLLEQAKTRLDVSVAMTMVIATTTLVWSILLLLFSTSTVLFLLVGVLGIFGTAIFYEVALHSFRSFSEVVRNAVDLFRFDLLRSLHIALPIDSEAEHELWKRLTEQASLTSTDKITYTHEAP